MRDIGLRGPTLDEVFLQLIGRPPATEGEQPSDDERRPDRETATSGAIR